MVIREEDVQQLVADYLTAQYPNVIFHSDYGSGAKLTIGQVAKQKRLNGGRRAWPDMFIAKARKRLAGLHFYSKGGKKDW